MTQMYDNGNLRTEEMDWLHTVTLLL